MTDWSPTGAPYAVSERASASADLERAYRRLVRFYPRSFRRENTEEIIAVLLATAREDQRRPSLPEAADLLRGATLMRLGLSGCPRTVLYAVRLMYLGALAEVALLAGVVLSASRIEAYARGVALRSIGPHPTTAAVHQALATASSVVGADLTADVTITVFAIAAWLFLAWANGKGSPYARVGALISFAFYATVSLFGFATGDLTVAPVAVTISCAVIALGLAANILLIAKPSWPYYERQAVAR
jgi:hypothetical protein